MRAKRQPNRSVTAPVMKGAEAMARLPKTPLRPMTRPNRSGEALATIIGAPTG